MGEKEKIKELKKNSKISFSFTTIDGSRSGSALLEHCYYPIEDIDVVNTWYGGYLVSEEIDNYSSTRESINEFFKRKFNKSLDQVRTELYQFFITFDPDPDTNIVFEIARENGKEIVYDLYTDDPTYEGQIEYK